MKRTLFLSLLALGLITGCASQERIADPDLVATAVVETLAAAPTVTPAPTPTPLPSTDIPTATAEPTPDFDLAATYQDSALGYAFDYPAGWAVAYQEGQSRGTFFQFARADFTPDPDAGGLPEEEILLQVTELIWEPSQDLAAFLDVRRQAWDSSGAKVLSEDSWQWGESIPAVTVIVEGIDGEQSLSVFTYVEDRYLVFSGTDQYALLEAVARTLRPAG